MQPLFYLFLLAVNLNGPEEGTSVEVPCVRTVTINVGQNGGVVNHPLACPTLCQHADLNQDGQVGVGDTELLGQIPEEHTREAVHALVGVYMGQTCEDFE